MTALARKFGERVRQLRGDRRLTQADLAERASVSEQWIRRIETGTASPSFETIEALAAALQARPSDLFGGDLPTTPDAIFAVVVEGLEPAQVAWLIEGARMMQAQNRKG